MILSGGQNMNQNRSSNRGGGQQRGARTVELQLSVNC